MSSTRRMVMLRRASSVTMHVSINQESLDNQNRDGQDEEDVNMNSVNVDTFYNNNNEKNKSIPAPIQGEVTSKRHQKSKEQKKEENEQLKEERRLKFRKLYTPLARNMKVPAEDCH